MNSILIQPIKKILVCRPDRLGDVLLTLPVIYNLKQAYPDSDITYICNKYTASILGSYRLITNLIYYDDYINEKGTRGILRLSQKLKVEKFDLALHLLPRFPLTLATYLANIRYNIGTGFRLYSFLFSMRQYDQRKLNQYHEADYNLRLLEKTGISTKYNSLTYELFNFQDNIKHRIESIIRSQIKADTYIVIHPGSGGSSIDWPIEYFISLIKQLNTLKGMKIVITGVQSEKKFLEPLYQANISIIDLVDKFNLTELAVFLNSASLFISNSTGPLHLAVAMGTPVLGFYPNAPGLGPGRWGPYQRSPLQFLTPGPDNKVSPSSDNNDMSFITPEIAFNRVKEILAIS